MPTREISTDDIIDSRDVIARISDLETDLQAEFDAWREELDATKEEIEEFYHSAFEDGDPLTAPSFEDWLTEPGKELSEKAARWLDLRHVHELDDWLKLDSREHGLYDAEVDELLKLRALAEEGEGVSDWSWGATLIRETYFEDYAQEFAKDIGALPRNASWPASCIDWEQAARELAMDFTQIDFDGVTYYAR